MPALSPSRAARALALLAIGGASLILPGIAAATLGEQEASVAEDAVAARATIRMQQRATYRVHQIDTDSGTVLREYVNAGGTVFAVTWKGPMMPDLKQTLGQFVDAYAASAKLKRMPHRAVLVNQDDLVIESAGHARAFRGVAYLPKLMPAGVTAGDLQ